MSLRRWFPALLLAVAVLATIPYGPVLRERLYRVGQPILLAERSVPTPLPFAATPARVAVGSDPVSLFRTEDLEALGTWTPPTPCAALGLDSEGLRCTDPATPPAGAASVARDGPIQVLGLSDRVVIGSAEVPLPGPALDLLIQRDVVHVATGETGLRTIRLSTGATVFTLPGPALALGGTDRTLVIAGPDRLRVYDMVPGKRRVVPGVGLLLLLAVPWAGRRAWGRGPRSVAWGIGIGGLVAWKLLSLAQIPIEAVHLLEFTVFGALACRALAPGRAPWAATVAATGVALSLGCVDEALQWWHPVRTGDIRDVWTDGLAGGLGALAAWQVLGWTDAEGAGRRWVWRLAAASLLILAGFQHLVHGFGQQAVHPEHGTWISRGLDVDTARSALREHGHLPYGAFLRLHGKHSSPSAHEVRGRLFRRDFWLAREDLEIACGEQGILDHAFPGVTARTPFVLAPATALRCEDVDSSDYASPISGAAVTRLRPLPWWGLALLLASLAWHRGRSARTGPVRGYHAARPKDGPRT